MMHASQALLLVLLLAFVLYAFRLRSTTVDRLVYLTLWGVGTVLVLRPEWTNVLAAWLGIGRGADLLFYLFIVFSLFQMASSAAERRRMQRDIGALARALAIAQRRAPPESPPESPPSVVEPS